MASRQVRIFYILDPEYNRIIKKLDAPQLAELLGVKREHLDCYLTHHTTYKGLPIAEE